MACNQQDEMRHYTRENARYLLRVCLDNLRLNNEQHFRLGLPPLTAKQCAENFAADAGIDVDPNDTPGYGPAESLDAQPGPAHNPSEENS